MTTMDLYRRELTRERVLALLSDSTFAPPKRHKTYFVPNDRGLEIGLKPLAQRLVPTVANPNGYDVAKVLLEKGIRIHVRNTTEWHAWMTPYELRGLVVREPG